MEVEKSRLIALTSNLTEEQVLKIFAISGNWNDVAKWSKLSNTGMSFKDIMIAASYGRTSNEFINRLN